MYEMLIGTAKHFEKCAAEFKERGLTVRSEACARSAKAFREYADKFMYTETLRLCRAMKRNAKHAA